MQKGLPVGLLIAFGLVLVGCFLPWGTISFDWSDAKVSIGGIPVEGQPLGNLAEAIPGLAGAAKGTLPVSPWAGYATLLGLQLPNWLVLAAAAFLAAFGVMECFPHTRVPVLARASFCLYGVVHLGALGSDFVQGGKADTGFFLTAAAFAVLTILTLRESRQRPVLLTPTP